MSNELVTENMDYENEMYDYEDEYYIAPERVYFGGKWWTQEEAAGYSMDVRLYMEFCHAGFAYFDTYEEAEKFVQWVRKHGAKIPTMRIDFESREAGYCVVNAMYFPIGKSGYCDRNGYDPTAVTTYVDWAS